MRASDTDRLPGDPGLPPGCSEADVSLAADARRPDSPGAGPAAEVTPAMVRAFWHCWGGDVTADLDDLPAPGAERDGALLLLGRHLDRAWQMFRREACRR